MGHAAAGSTSGNTADAAALKVSVPQAPWQEGAAGRLHCYGCLRDLSGGEAGLSERGEEEAGGAALVLRCPLCSQCFCFECDTFVHESLFNCPGCECGAAAAGGTLAASTAVAAAAGDGGG